MIITGFGQAGHRATGMETSMMRAKRRISIEKMARIWRYSVDQEGGEGLSMRDFLDLNFDVETFGDFLDINRDAVQLYEEATA